MARSAVAPVQSTDSPLAVDPATAARMLGVSRALLYERLAAGEIKSFKIGRARRIRVTDLYSWLDQQAAEHGGYRA